MTIRLQRAPQNPDISGVPWYSICLESTRKNHKIFSSHVNDTKGNIKTSLFFQEIFQSIHYNLLAHIKTEIPVPTK